MNTNKSCHHCQENVIFPENLRLGDKEYVFCCNGCKTVFEILNNHDLSNYYNIRKKSENSIFSPITLSKQKFLYLDEEKFKKKYVLETKESFSLTFYLEGVHCIACLWLIEKLPLIEDNILSANLNMAKSSVEVHITKRIDSNFSTVAKRLESLGYPPHPILEESSLKELQKKEEHKDLIRIAASFFCAGNIMLISIPSYTGATGIITRFFDYLGGFLFLPILLYAAIPFYKSAFNSLVNKSISIDLPIVMAIIAGGIFSIYNVLIQSPHIYFDTLAILVFLLLLSRYLLKKSQQKGLAASEVSNFFTNVTANKIEKDGNKKELFANFLKVGDLIEIAPGETVPVDCTIQQGISSVNCSLITGEVTPIKVSPSSNLYSGTINLNSIITAKVTSTASSSKLGQILKDVELGWNKKTKIISFTDSISKYFISFILFLSIIIFGYFAYFGMYEDAFIRTLTLIIITCPCALGLTTPLSLTLTLSKLAKKGILVKDETVIEKVSHLKHVFFDKTGTLTNGNFKVTKWESIDANNYFPEVYNLEKSSEHPIAIAIKKYIKENSQTEIKSISPEDYQEIIGIGPTAKLNGSRFEIKPIINKKLASTSAGLYKEGELLVRINLEDSIKTHVPDILKLIRELGINTFLISGDNNKIVQKIGKILEFPVSNIFSETKPKDKSSIIQKYSNTMMLGDGANDAIALSNADVGVAVHGSVDISLRASNVFLTNNNLENIIKLIISSRETLKLIKRNLSLSLLYNVFGCILAINGDITPLLAAILMPISSFTVLLSTLWGTKNLRTQLKDT